MPWANRLGLNLAGLSSEQNRKYGSVKIAVIVTAAYYTLMLGARDRAR